MKKYLALFLLFLAYSYAQSQIDLGIIWQKSVKTKIISSKISNDGKFVYVTNPGWNTIRKMSLETGEYISAFDNKNYYAKDDIQRLFLSSDGTKLISQSWNTVCIWDVINEKVVKEIYFDSTKGTENGIESINVSLDGKTLAVNIVNSLVQPKGYKSYILMYDLEQYKEISRIPMPDNGTLAKVCLSSDSKLLAVGYYYISQTFPSKIYAQKVCLLNAENGKLIKEIDKFDNVDILEDFYNIQFSQDNNLIAYNTSYNDQFRIYNINLNRIIIKNDLNEVGRMLNILTNNNEFLIYSGNTSNYVFSLNLYTFQKKINSFKIGVECYDLKQINGLFKTFIYGFGEITLLEEKPLSVLNDNNLTLGIFYINQTNELKINNIPISSNIISISDLTGKILFSENTQNQNLNYKIINIDLQNGVYLLSIKTNSSDIIQKFQVRR